MSELGTHSKYSVSFDVRALLKEIVSKTEDEPDYTYRGIVETVHRLLEQSGSTVKPKTIGKWMERDTIPSDAVATLVSAYMEKTGKIIPLFDYLKREDERKDNGHKPD